MPRMIRSPTRSLPGIRTTVPRRRRRARRSPRRWPARSGAGSWAATAVNIEAGGRFNGVAQPNVLYVGGANRMFGRSALAAAQTPLTELTTYNSTVNQTVQDFSMDPRDWHRLYVATGSNNIWLGNV